MIGHHRRCPLQSGRPGECSCRENFPLAEGITVTALEPHRNEYQTALIVQLHRFTAMLDFGQQPNPQDPEREHERRLALVPKGMIWPLGQAPGFGVDK